MGTTGFIIGIFSFIGFLIGLIPFLGWFNWFNIPFAALGLIISILATGLNEKSLTPAVTGIVLSLFAVFLGGIRLIIGGGLI